MREFIILFIHLFPLASALGLELNAAVSKVGVDLQELQESYKRAYAKNLGPFFYWANTSTFPNPNRAWKFERRCQEMSFLLQIQHERLLAKYGDEYVSTANAIDLVRNPSAWLFRKENYTGERVKYHFLATPRYGICSNTEELMKPIKSVLTKTKCIRLFDEHHCEGSSMAVYPGSKNSQVLQKAGLSKVLSIGPCLQDEFIHARVKDPTRGEMKKNPQFLSSTPELLQFNSKEKYSKAFIPIHQGFDHEDDFRVLKGTKERIEYVQTTINTKPRNNGTIHPNFLNEAKRFYDTLDTQNGDVPCYAIPLPMGGQETTYNVFPGSLSTFNEWNEICGNISKSPYYLLAPTQFTLNFIYFHENTTRPIYFAYHILYGGARQFQVSYGRVLNGIRNEIVTDEKIPVDPNISQSYETTKIFLKNVLEKHSQMTYHRKKFPNASITNVNKIVTQRACKTDEDTKQSKGFPSLEEYRNGIRNPMALLFSGENFTGDVEMYDFNSARKKGLCYVLRTLYGNVKSLVTFGTCVRLFTGLFCHGLSIAFHARSNSALNRNIWSPQFSHAQSLGPCLPDELKFRSGNFLSLFNQKPIEFPSPQIFSQFPLVFSSPCTDIWSLEEGSRNRVEFLVGEVTGKPREISKPLEHLEGNDREEGDVPFYGIPLELGGPSNKTWNIFPASPSCVEDWKEITEGIFSCDYFHVSISLKFVYEKDTSNRPTLFYYHIIHDNYNILYGRIFNKKPF